MNSSNENPLMPALIRLTDYKGRMHLVSIYAISTISEAATSSQWHGIKSIVKLIDGEKLEVNETVQQISQKIVDITN